MSRYRIRIRNIRIRLVTNTSFVPLFRRTPLETAALRLQPNETLYDKSPSETAVHGDEIPHSCTRIFTLACALFNLTSLTLSLERLDRTLCSILQRLHSNNAIGSVLRWASITIYIVTNVIANFQFVQIVKVAHSFRIKKRHGTIPVSEDARIDLGFKMRYALVLLLAAQHE